MKQSTDKNKEFQQDENFEASVSYGAETITNEKMCTLFIDCK